MRFTDTCGEADTSKIRILDVADEEQERMIDVEFPHLLLVLGVERHTAATREPTRQSTELGLVQQTAEFTFRRELDTGVLVVRRNTKILTRSHTGQRIATSREEIFKAGPLHNTLHG